MSLSRRSFVIERLRKERLLSLLAKGHRLDDRGLLDYRPVKIETNVIDKAEGSAKVDLGDTSVIAGVKVELDRPFKDTPDKGILIVNTEFLPFASPYIEPGPPDENAIELARVVDRGIRESGMVDLSKLAVKPGEQVYAIFADVDVLNIDGNLFDATSYAVVSALATAKIPEYEVDGDGTVKATGNIVQLPITTIPISITAAKIGDYIVFDPTEEEEAVIDTRLTIVFSEDNTLCAIQKGEPGSWTPDEIVNLIGEADGKAREIREIVKRSISP